MKLYKFLYSIAIKSKYYQIWNKIYRKFFEKYGKRKKDFLDFSHKLSIEETQLTLDLIQYYPDTWKELWDSTHSPEYCRMILAEIMFGAGQLPGSFDCDDFAILASYTLETKYNPEILQIFYKRKGSFKFSGHMICVFQEKDSYGHMGNWGTYRGCKSLKEIAEFVAKTMDSELVGYSLLTKELKLKKVFV